MFKDTVITARQKKLELTIYLLCFASALIFNIIGIIKYNTPAKEIYTQLHIVFLVSVFFYLLTIIIRLIYFGIRKLIFPGTRKRLSQRL
jgi:hypothetical protein